VSASDQVNRETAAPRVTESPPPAPSAAAAAAAAAAARNGMTTGTARPGSSGLLGDAVASRASAAYAPPKSPSPTPTPSAKPSSDPDPGAGPAQSTGAAPATAPSARPAPAPSPAPAAPTGPAPAPSPAPAVSPMPSRSRSEEISSPGAGPLPGAARVGSGPTATQAPPRTSAPPPRPPAGTPRTMPSSSSLGGAAQPAGAPRSVRLAVAGIDPWSVLKLSFLLSVAIGVALVVASIVLWSVLNGMGVFDQINRVLRDISGTEQQFDIFKYVGFSRVVSLSTVLGVVNVVLMTALCTLGAFLYNLGSGLVGGLHVTLTDE